MDEIESKIVRDFIVEARDWNFECSPTFTMDEGTNKQFISLAIADESEIPILKIDFLNYNRIHIFPSIKRSNADLDWLFNKLFEMLYILEEA